MSLSIKRAYSTTETFEQQRFGAFKRIRLQTNVCKKVYGKPLEALALLEGASNSKELLDVLVKLADNPLLEELSHDVILSIVQKLMDLYRRERDSDSSVRMQILRLLANLAELQVSELVVDLIEQIANALKLEKSKNVLATGLLALYKIGAANLKLLPISSMVIIAQFAKQQLNTNLSQLQINALMVLSEFDTLLDAKQKDIDIIGQFINSDESRVRAQALRSLLTLYKRGVKLPTDLYPRAVEALKDDYECVRLEALQLIFELGISYPELMIASGSKQDDDLNEIRLIDAAFIKVCGALCDVALQIRIQAAKYLGRMPQVGLDFLHQTLDKKLMSNLRRKKTAHERGAQLVTSGEFSTGKRWADDAPQEQLDATSITFIASGACGALVHGLEDEYMEVRTAAVDSMCQLALAHPDFAVMSLDFLVDMFNDEIEDVRLKAIQSLTAIAPHIVLREDQLEIMLTSLEDYSVDVREGLHLMLGACRVSTQACMLMVVMKLLDVLSKYPEDKYSAFDCMRKVGQKHPNLCMGVTTHLLHCHPFFDSAERDVEDPSYLCLLILLFNAAENAVPIISIFPDVTLRHYAYLRDAMPELVPQLPIEGASTTKVIDSLAMIHCTGQYLEDLIKHINEVHKISQNRLQMLQRALDNLKRLADIDNDLFGTANFLATFLEVQMQIEQLQPCALNAEHSRTQLKESLSQLLRNCLKLQHLFSGYNYSDTLLVKQLCLRASALHLILIVRDRSQSALGACQMLLQNAADISNFLDDKQAAQPDEFTIALLTELANIPDPKPGRVFREILPLVENAQPVHIPLINVGIRMCTAHIKEPNLTYAQDNIIKVTAGLIASIPFVAEIDHLNDAQKQNVRIKIKYPDQVAHTTPVKMNNFKRVMTGNGDAQQTLRLRTTVLLSHAIWTEASVVELTLCLAVRSGVDLELCKPAKVMFAPKPVRRGI